MKRTYQIAIAMVFGLLSCSDDETKYYAEPEVESFVNSFFQEAEARGVAINKDNLIVEVKGIQSISEFKTEKDQRFVRINPSAFNYNKQSNPLYIEGFLFHEMAKVYLKREPVTNGNSIMNTYLLLGGGYSAAQRTALLDELFSH